MGNTIVIAEKKTLLMFAVQNYNFELADTLIAHGADIKAKMSDGPGSSVIALKVLQ